jgi:hypothetical protein
MSAGEHANGAWAARVDERLDENESWRDDHEKKHFRDAATLTLIHGLVRAIPPRVEAVDRSVGHVVQAMTEGNALIDQRLTQIADEIGEVRLVIASGKHRDRLPSLSEYSPTVNEDGSVSLPPGALDSMRDAVARQRAEVDAMQRALEAKQHALELQETARAATDKALAQFRADEKQRQDDLKRESDERFDRIKKWLGILAAAGTLAGGAIGWLLHMMQHHS